MGSTGSRKGCASASFRSSASNGPKWCISSAGLYVFGRSRPEAAALAAPMPLCAGTDVAPEAAKAAAGPPGGAGAGSGFAPLCREGEEKVQAQLMRQSRNYQNKEKRNQEKPQTRARTHTCCAWAFLSL
jgi:hypothetical protein